MSVKVCIRKRLSRNFTLETEFESSGRTCLGILGASGSGKSMTLKCIAGIEKPDKGHIEINGRVLFDSVRKINLKPQERRVGYLFQNYALFPRMTVMENITAALPRKNAVKLARFWIERFELSGLEGRYPHQLSGGQQQRTALARMLIREPGAVLLDEPFSALDTNLREQMQISFPDFLKSCGDTIMVTHSRDEAYRLCGEVLVMENGRVLGKGETKELFANPGLVDIARITGCKNISPIKITGGQEVYALDWGLALRTAVPVPDGVTHVGIRAHDFVPLDNKIIHGGEAAQNSNRVRINIVKQSEDPFEKVVIFTNAAASPEEQKPIWWKFSKYLDYGVQPELYLPPESLFLLA